MITPALAEFLAHSLELESEARERYTEMADALAAHRNLEVAEFFQRMAAEAQEHLTEVHELSQGTKLPQLNAWDFDWPEAEPPETVSYEAIHYRMSLREAIALALAHERAAETYYRNFADNSTDSETVRIAGMFAEVESSHVAELQRLLSQQPMDATCSREEDEDPHMPE